MLGMLGDTVGFRSVVPDAWRRTGGRLFDKSGRAVPVTTTR